jgi:zinc transport system substrate-binding protein
MRLDLMKRPRLVLAVGVATVVTLSACGEVDDDPASAVADASTEAANGGTSGAGSATNPAGSTAPVEPALAVAAAFYPLEYVTREVGGDRVDVAALTPPGAEAHDLELTADSLVALTDADLLVYLDGFQPAIDDAVAQRSGPSLDVGEVATREYAEGGEHSDEEEGEHSDEEDHGSTDPHFWTDPTVMAEAAALVELALAEADPEGADVYAANADSLVADLEDLDAMATAALGSCEITTLVTAHEAFGYFADRYGFESEPISGLSPEDEPAPAELAAITDLVQEQGVTTVYTETLIPTDLADTVAAETGATTAVLDPVEGLTDESPGEDYREVMEANIQTVATGQQCA